MTGLKSEGYGEELWNVEIGEDGKEGGGGEGEEVERTVRAADQ